MDGVLAGAFLGGAGVVAGVIGTAGGITSLVAYPAHPLVVGAAGAAVALYNGYFGAGSGILMITLLLLTTESVVHRANGLKNVILLAADVLPAVVFAAVGTVVWRAALPLAAGAVAGGLVGPSVARRLPEALLRVLVGCCGVALAAYLFLRA